MDRARMRNGPKCHPNVYFWPLLLFMFSNTPSGNDLNIILNANIVNNVNTANFLVAIVDNRLEFGEHISSICTKNMQDDKHFF